MPLCEKLGIRVDALEQEAVVLRLAWSPDLCTLGGVLHGGAVMALADSAGAVCAFLNLTEGAAGTATIESKTNFLGAIRDGAVTARSCPLHK
ncbi:MAG: PaaI family thioesterase, partial [Acidimicrobiales bacterium]